MTAGLHHVTAISGPAARNRAFHATVLGQRLVKRTVNFDDTGTYHLYYGSETGDPGSILTFFPWANAAPGRLGSGETAETAFRVPHGALAFWADRLAKAGTRVDGASERFGQAALPFADPDGMRFALIEVDAADQDPVWAAAGIAPAYALRGLHGVTLRVAHPLATAAILTDVFGFHGTGRDGTAERFVAPGATVGGVVDLEAMPDAARGRQGAGSVHHVAFRAADDAAQAAMADRLFHMHGLAATAQKDRHYFRSVYFREPNGVLFEIATDAPGFAVDEPLATLGEALKLPQGLEPSRARIMAALPPLDLPETTMTDTFVHRFVPATATGRPTLLLLHGTGGDETDLLPTGTALAPGAALLSPRGRVLEGGMPRFFRRLAEGVFDPAEVRDRADALAGFVAAARERYGLAAPIALGFSNGANVAAAMMARHPGLLSGAILLRPMLVLPDEAESQPETPVLMISGRTDPIVPSASAEALAALLRRGGAIVDHRVLAAGHGLVQDDWTIARDWLAGRTA